MKSTLMIVHSFHVITTVHVKTSLVITAVYVGLAGLADTVITTWDLYAILLFAKMEATVEKLRT